MNTIFAHRFDLNRGAFARDIFVVFAATPNLVPEELASLLEKEIEQNLAPDEVLILVRNPAFDDTAIELMRISQNVATLARFAQRTTITLVGYDCLGSQARRQHISGPAPAFAISLDDVKRRALTGIFNNRHGFVESTATYHFENPSGRHTERFIRLSNILARGAEIAFIGFCTLPYVPKNVTIAYLDTPSLYAVVSAINEQRVSFGLPPILADNFSSYAGVESYRFSSIANAIVLISASSSGSLAARLIDEHNFAASRVTHLLFLGTDKSRSNIVCDLCHDRAHNEEGIKNRPSVEPAESCSMCARGSHAVKLQGDQFDFAGPQQDALLIRRDDGPVGLRGFMERFAGGGIFSVRLGRRARQLNVEPKALLSHGEFQKRLDYALRRSLPASLTHVIALDEDSLSLAEQVARTVSPNATVVRRENVAKDIPRETLTAIAIVAIIIESGRSLLDISRDLRSVAPTAPLIYFVGLSKTTGEPRRESLSSTLKQTMNPYPYDVIQIEEITLPLAIGPSPWDSELRLFRTPEMLNIAPLELRQTIVERSDRLRKTSVPLADELFLPNGAGRKLTLQPGFVFWPDGVPQRATIAQADVYFTIASVLQQLRSNVHRSQKAAIKSNWFQQTVLAPGNFGRFNDDIIQASILRAALPHEMNFVDAPSDSRELGRLIRRIILAGESHRGGAAAEFLLALATERLRLAREDIEVVLSKDISGLPMINFLQEVCRKRLKI
jgi:hypothetical protein